MRVFMLGWEFPPYISGGLGTACLGLTKAMSRAATDITFVLPRAVPQQTDTHVNLRGPKPRQHSKHIPLDHYGSDLPASLTLAQVMGEQANEPPGLSEQDRAKLAHVNFVAVPSRITSPYQTGRGSAFAAAGQPMSEQERLSSQISVLDAPMDDGNTPDPRGQYDGDLITEAQRYAAFCVGLAKGQSFDVVHAHDWMTYPAGMAAAAATGKPLVVHVHSTEFNRSGDHIHRQIFEIERRGCHAAVRVIAVSRFMARILETHYGVDPCKIDVVYNGIDNNHQPSPNAHHWTLRAGEKIVLFLGRITMQKGPEYFVAAAKKVLGKLEHVRFVMAGSGDQIRQIIELAAREGIGHKIMFTGFLRGADVDRIFNAADVYVMPSVSEPFGISALEAIRHDVPVIMSKTSGVSEVVQHALKVDFWDVDQIADKIIAVLTRPPLASTMRHHADQEIRKLTWDDAASRCLVSYEKAIAEMPEVG